MINGKFIMIQEQIDRIVENIADVYATGCYEHKWISKEAKDNYDLMQLKLKYLLEDQNRILGRVTWPSTNILYNHHDQKPIGVVKSVRRKEDGTLSIRIQMFKKDEPVKLTENDLISEILKENSHEHES